MIMKEKFGYNSETWGYHDEDWRMFMEYDTF